MIHKSYNKPIRAVAFGPTGVGKSQFCNFVQRDLANKINKVSHSLNSCTKFPQSNYFKRKDIDLEFIDTAGSNDSGNNDIENLAKVCEYLKKKNEIDHIILLLNYANRLEQDTREYIQTLGKMFTPKEFYTHLSVVFTHLPEKETKKVKEKKKIIKDEVCNILKEIFDIKPSDRLPQVNVYFVNTEIDEDDDGNKSFDEKSQITVDLLIEYMKINVNRYPPIDTTNLEITGKNAKIRQEEQERKIKELQEKIKQEELRREKERQEKIRLENEIKKCKKEDEARKRKEKELQELERKQEEERKRLEQIQNEAKKKEEENRKREEALKKIAAEHKIDIQTLDSVIDGAGYFAAGCGISAGLGILMWIGGAALTCICPVAGPILLSAGMGATGSSGIFAAGAGAVAGVTKIIKEVKK